MKVMFGFSDLLFQSQPGRLKSPPMINVEFFICVAFLIIKSKFFRLVSSDVLGLQKELKYSVFEPTMSTFALTISVLSGGVSSYTSELISSFFIAMRTPPPSLSVSVFFLSFLYNLKLSGNISTSFIFGFSQVSVQNIMSGFVLSMMLFTRCCLFLLTES